VLNALTIDVEDYFHTEAMARVAPRHTWDSLSLRVEDSTWRLLELFERCNVRCTMFFLGWVAERCPRLVAAAAEMGHEVGCHSYWHRPVYGLTREEFREDTKRAKDVIESACGRPVHGYRAPSFSMLQDMKWAWEILAETGFRYSSSCHPIHHDLYNNPDAPRLPYSTEGGVLEIPITTWRMLDHNLPMAGGAYLRILPWFYLCAGMRRVVAAGERMMIYLHPWEIDANQPRLTATMRSRLRQYTGLNGMQARLTKVIQTYKFAGVMEAYGLAKSDSNAARLAAS
jgi:polysaccharide deacetylase family protein (PEP-CTERM system associated)